MAGGRQRTEAKKVISVGDVHNARGSCVNICIECENLPKEVAIELCNLGDWFAVNVHDLECLKYTMSLRYEERIGKYSPKRADLAGGALASVR